MGECLELGKQMRYGQQMRSLRRQASNASPWRDHLSSDLAGFLDLCGRKGLRAAGLMLSGRPAASDDSGSGSGRLKNTLHSGES